MGIEKISGQAAYQSHATQAAQVNKVSAAPAAETNNSQDSVNNAAHIAAVMQMSTSQRANADSKYLQHLIHHIVPYIRHFEKSQIPHS